MRRVISQSCPCLGVAHAIIQSETTVPICAPEQLINTVHLYSLMPVYNMRSVVIYRGRATFQECTCMRTPLYLQSTTFQGPRKRTHPPIISLGSVVFLLLSRFSVESVLLCKSSPVSPHLPVCSLCGVAGVESSIACAV